MNPLTNMKNIKKLSEKELKSRNRTSWHDQYRGSAWVFIGGLSYDLTEGDIICVFSQYGEPVNVNLVRDKDTGKPKGFCFLCYEDQRSTDLAVDNFNGIKVLGRTIRVDHVENYKLPKSLKDEKKETVPTTANDNMSKKKLVGKNCSSSDEAGEGRLSSKKHKKKRREGEVDSCGSGKKKRKKESKLPKKKRSLDGNRSAESDSDKRRTRKEKPKFSDSDRESVSSSSSSSSSSSESSDVDESDKKSKKKRKNEKQKRSRTIEDLKREARLIHAELKRRQRMEDGEKKMRSESDEERRRKGHLKSKRAR